MRITLELHEVLRLRLSTGRGKVTGQSDHRGMQRANCWDSVMSTPSEEQILPFSIKQPSLATHVVKWASAAAYDVIR